LGDLRAELAENKEQYDHRLRSLRQEHEKIKTQYEARIASLTASTSTKGGPPSTVASAAAGGSATAGSVVKTLPQAQARIRELESDIEKLRAFYIRKVTTIN